MPLARAANYKSTVMLNRADPVGMSSRVVRWGKGLRLGIVALLLCNSAGAAEALPEDPSVRDLKFVDGSERFPRKFFLREHLLGRSHWVDASRLLTTVVLSETFDSRDFNNNGKVVTVDTQTGQVRDVGYSGNVICYAEGRVVIRRGGAVDGVYFYGRLGAQLQSGASWPKDTELNEQSCSLVPTWKRPGDLPQGMLSNRRFLEQAHGVLVSWQRIATGFPLARLYLERPAGERVDISFNPGEEIVEVRRVPFEDAYLLVPRLADTQPVKIWQPRFVRLLHPDGKIERFSIPGPIMQKVQANDGVASAQYTRRGVLWNLQIYDGRPDKEKLSGNYLVLGGELLRIAADFPGLDGCRLVGSQKSPRSTERRILKDYYLIDVCKGG